jgi:Tol biopolymer transport system component
MTPTSTRPITGWTSPVERRNRFALGAAVLAIVALVITVIIIRGRGGDGIVLANLAPDRQVTFTGDVASIDLAPDGRTVAYTTTDRRRVMVTDLDGGGTTEFFNAPTGMMIDRAMWTPDGSRLLFSTFVGRHELYAIPRLGGEPQLLADLNHLVGASGVDFHGAAPDGALVFDLGDRWLYIGTDPQQLRVDARGVTGDDLLELPGVDVVISAVVSPDGRWIAYRGTDSLGQDIVGVVSRDGTSGPGPLSGITGSLGGWSADGSGLYLFRGRGGGNADLYHVPLDPATATMLGEAGLVYPGLAHPGATSISKDGRRLVYSSGPVAINVREILFDETAISDDNPTRLLTRGTARWGAEGYLADGRVIITRGTPDGYEILAVDSTGRQESLALRSGTEIGQCVGRIRQSPDGRYLALPEVRRGENAGSVPVILDMTTGQVETLSVPEEICHFAWAPDGSMLAAMTRYSRDKIVVVDRASGQGRLLQLDCGDRCEFSYENIVMSPEWPYAGVTSEIDIWVVNLEDGTLRHLQDRTWIILGWVDDHVWFYRNPNQRSDVPWGGIYRIPAAGGTEELMLDLPPDCSAEALAPAALGIVCEMTEARQDLHVIDGFDPQREVN